MKRMLQSLMAKTNKGVGQVYSKGAMQIIIIHLQGGQCE